VAVCRHLWSWCAFVIAVVVQVAIKMSVPCNCASSEQRNRREVRELKTDFGELELHGYEANK
jgi:hypothetical protein